MIILNYTSIYNVSPAQGCGAGCSGNYKNRAPPYTFFTFLSPFNATKRGKNITGGNRSKSIAFKAHNGETFGSLS
jgi:hypothetical protein